MSQSKPSALKRKILFGLTGSIACYKSATVLSQLKKAGHDVRVVATSSALKFIGEATLEGLTGQRVLTDTFASGNMMDHIHLARWADIFVVAPMTANHLNKFALGLADDLLTTLSIAYENTKPLYIAPAMNSVMYAHDSVQTSLKTLKARGVQVIEPDEGLLACGETGPGRMAEPEEILKALLPDAISRGEILVTFGGTRELIDGVRSITNTSTGRTGAHLVDELTRQGFHVTALCAENSVRPQTVTATHTFIGHQDLDARLAALLDRHGFSTVIHLAAVSDYSVDKIVVGGHEMAPSAETKLSSDQPMTLQLKVNTKIVNELRAYSRNSRIQVIAFKLTNTLNPAERTAAVEKLLRSSQADLVVHNDFHDIAAGKHKFQIFGAGPMRTALDVPSLATELATFIDSNKKSSPFTERRTEVDHDLMP